jgi:autotransporter adhesin
VAAANAVQYDDAGRSDVTLGGTGAAAPVGLHNVAAGAVSATSTDAVNGAQLHATNQQAAQNSTDITNLSAGIANGTVGLVQQTAGAPGAGAITVGALTGGTSIDISGTDGTRVISGVAAGLRATDAVNLAQMTSGLADTLTAANAYTDSRLAGIDFDLDDLRRDADAGTAAAMAIAGLPQAFTPGAGMIAGGIGVWRDEAALAVGLSKAFRDGHTVVKTGATMTTRSNTFGANVAIGYQF